MSQIQITGFTRRVEKRGNMGTMESQRGTAGLAPSATAMKDSPAVERALSRSKLYLLISWSMLYPEDDEFLDYLQSGEFVQDGRSAMESLMQSLDGIGGERAKKKLAAVSQCFD